MKIWDGIITAVKRIVPKYTSINNEITDVIAKSDINVRTGVAKLSVKKNDRNQENIQNVILKNNEEFIQISEASCFRNLNKFLKT